MSQIVRHSYMIGFREAATRKETYGGEAGWAFVEAMQVRPANRESKTVVVFSHPIGGGSFLPIMSGLARAGHHVVYVNTRYRGNDTALIMEKCVVDLGADLACPRSHTQRLFEAIPHPDKEMHEIPKASHYYTGQREELAQCIGIHSNWLDAHGLDD